MHDFNLLYLLKIPQIVLSVIKSLSTNSRIISLVKAPSEDLLL